MQIVWQGHQWNNDDYLPTKFRGRRIPVEIAPLCLRDFYILRVQNGTLSTNDVTDFNNHFNCAGFFYLIFSIFVRKTVCWRKSSRK